MRAHTSRSLHSLDSIESSFDRDVDHLVQWNFSVSLLFPPLTLMLETHSRRPLHTHTADGTCAPFDTKYVYYVVRMIKIDRQPYKFHKTRWIFPCHLTWYIIIIAYIIYFMWCLCLFEYCAHSSKSKETEFNVYYTHSLGHQIMAIKYRAAQLIICWIFFMRIFFGRFNDCK